MVRILTSLMVALVLVVVSCSSALADTEQDQNRINALLNDAQNHIWLGISNNGANRSFKHGLELVERASEQLENSALPQAEKRILSQQLDALREQLTVLTELYLDRFYGVFPLARLLTPHQSHDGEQQLTEHMFHPPDIAAVDAAANNFASKVDNNDRPHVVIRSTPKDRELENVTFEVLARSATCIPVFRRELVKMLSAEDLAEFDRGLDSPATIQHLLDTLDIASLIVLDINKRSEASSDLVKYMLEGDLYVRGLALQGSADQVSPHVRVATIFSVGTMLDRRAQFWPILASQVALLLAAMLWSARVDWSLDSKLKTSVKLAIGAGLFTYGRVFAMALEYLLARFAPDPGVLVSAAWWWPAAMGFACILVVGFAAWIGQAVLTDVVPGSRGSRAVGTIFALSALGAASLFIRPLMLLDQSAGFATLTPFVIVSVSLAALFAFAARTGPPVPHYFAIGPALAAPMAGVFLMMASPTYLWWLVALTAMMYVAATIRHEMAANLGTEEPEPSAETAANTDQKRLVKLSKRIKNRL